MKTGTFWDSSANAVFFCCNLLNLFVLPDNTNQLKWISIKTKIIWSPPTLSLSWSWDLFERLKFFCSLPSSLLLALSSPLCILTFFCGVDELILWWCEGDEVDWMWFLILVGVVGVPKRLLLPEVVSWCLASNCRTVLAALSESTSCGEIKVILYLKLEFGGRNIWHLDPDRSA